MKTPLQSRVDKALDDVIYMNEFHAEMEKSSKEIAQDLKEFSTISFEDETLEDLEVCVKDYQNWYFSTKKSESLLRKVVE
jgi:hypothetical protein